MKQLWFRSAWLDDRFASSVRIAVDADGAISEVVPGAAAEHCEHIQGIAIPGMINVHSHAFQRGMAGLTEHRLADRDNFWTWRRWMYHFLRWLTPEDCYVIARQLYLEMLRAGYTAVGEFHYLHNDPDGRPYAAKFAIAEALMRAAADTGIRLCLLPTLYQRGGFRQPLEDGQKRFALTVDDCLDLAAAVEGRQGSSPRLHTGLAIHSLRAVDLPTARRAAAMFRDRFGRRPIHMHAAEQQREVDECVEAHGRRPVELALDELGADESWCLIHATHLSPHECERLARSGAVAGLCPTTEANLGDGVFPSEPYVLAGGQFAIGTDSQVSVDPRGELRWIEYVQRLLLRRRVVLGLDSSSCGSFLCAAAWRGGRRALGLPIGQFHVGDQADLVVIDDQHPSLSGLAPDRWLDSFVFCDLGNPIRHVMVAGEWVVRDGSQALMEISRREFADTVRQILNRA